MGKKISEVRILEEKEFPVRISQRKRG